MPDYTMHKALMLGSSSKPGVRTEVNIHLCKFS